MLEYSTSNYSVFAITMRKIKNPNKVTQVDYVNQINYFKSWLHCKFDDVKFENTSGLHMHGIVRVPTQTSLNCFRVRGWSIKLEEIYDYNGWIKYINKDQIQDSSDDPTDTPEDERFEIPKIKLFGNI